MPLWASLAVGVSLCSSRSPKKGPVSTRGHLGSFFCGLQSPSLLGEGVGLGRGGRERQLLPESSRGCCRKAYAALDPQEVNEGVQALSNSKEEKKGVAAALLAPLLPDVVKEEEERWRRKVICKEEVEPPPEEEAKAEEAAAAPEEPQPSRDPLEDTLQEDLCSVVQSGESAEEEEEQDTLELEMVLERKKVRGKFLSPKRGHGCSQGIVGNKPGAADIFISVLLPALGE